MTSIVSEPAANPAGMFSAFCAVDMQKLQMNEAPVEVKKELSEPTVEARTCSAPIVEATAPAPIEAKAELAKCPKKKGRTEDGRAYPDGHRRHA
jgi:hypothetical protein